MEKQTKNIVALAAGLVVGYLAFCKLTKQSGAKSLSDANIGEEEDLGKEETPISGGGGGGGMLAGSTPVMGTPVYQNYPAPIVVNTPPTMVINPSQLSSTPSAPSSATSSPTPISTVTATKDIPTTTTPIQTTKPMVSSIVNPTTATKFSGFMEFDGNDKFLNELL